MEKKKSVTSQPTAESDITNYVQTYEDRIKTYEPQKRFSCLVMQKKYDSVHRYENLKEFAIKDLNKYKKKMEELLKKEDKDGQRA